MLRQFKAYLVGVPASKSTRVWQRCSATDVRLLMSRLASDLRVVPLCGSIRPLFSGTDDYTENLTRALRGQGVKVHSIDLGHWQLSWVGRLLGLVAAARPDA